MSITPQMIKELRDETGAGFMDCKQALEQAGGDMEEARKILRQKGAVIATKRASKGGQPGRDCQARSAPTDAQAC